MIIDFKDYTEAANWIDASVKEHGQIFFTSTEYRIAYPEIRRLHQAEKSSKHAQIVLYDGKYAVQVGATGYLASGRHQFGGIALFETPEHATEYANKYGYTIIKEQ